MRYFKDRSHAGKILAKKLSGYMSENVAVVSLSEGGVVVGFEIAKALHGSLFLLTMENVRLPSEPEPVGTLSTAGTFTYNRVYSPGELEEINSEYHSYVEQGRLQAFQKLNRITKDAGEIPKKLLKGHIVIIVSDGLSSGLSLDVAADFFKPVPAKKLIAVTPIASVPAVDRMHILADKIEILGVIEDYMNTNHYYENNDLPSHEQLGEMVQKISLSWENQPTKKS